MRYFTDTRGRLVFTISKEEQHRLFRFSLQEGGFDSDDTMKTLFDPMLTDNHFDWIEPVETGDLTSAPMLGLRDDENSPYARWAFMDYQIISPQRQLMENGRCEWLGGDIREHHHIQLSPKICILNFLLKEENDNDRS